MTHHPDELGISRRRFLTGIGVGATAAVAAGYGLSVWQNGDPSTATKAGRAPTAPKLGGRADRTLVVVELGGGNDGLNTVVPMTDPAYASLRPTLGVHDAVAIDGEVGLAPQLAKLTERYRAGQVAIVEGLGYDDPSLSHFASLAYWWTGTPGAASGAGWLGRYLDGTVGLDDPLAGIGIGPVPSPALVGNKSFATAIADATGLQPSLPAWADTADDLVAAWSTYAPASPDPTTLMGQLQRAIGLTVQARARLDTTLDPLATGAMPSDGLTAPTAPAGQGQGQEGRGRYASSAAASLQLAAQLVASEHQPRVVYVSGLGDYDTHQGIAARHPALLADLDAGIEGFFTTLDAAGATDRALLMTVSEFGRRPAENGSGTDHGTAAPHFVIGAKVKGGRYGAPPSLSQLDRNGNLAHTTDFRTLYATAVQGWLGVDAEAVVGAGYAPIPLFV